MNANASEINVKQSFATGLGFFTASALPAAYLAIAFPLSGERDLLSIAGTFFLACCFSANATIMFALPLFILLKKFNMINLLSACISGVFAGVIMIYIVRFSLSVELFILIRYGVLGGVAGFLFWVIWRMGDENSIERQ